ETIALFATRGGARLNYIYQLFCHQMMKKSPVESKVFNISRIAALKTCGNISPKEVERFKEIELKDISEVEFNKLIVNSSESSDLEYLTDKQLKERVNTIYNEQHVLYKEYLKELVGNRKNILFCDTGLYGNTQIFLSKAFPEYAWFGVYFMRSNHKNLNSDHFRTTIGLLSESDLYDPFVRSSIFLKYWHLIEDVLEPRTKSIKGLSLKSGQIKE